MPQTTTTFQHRLQTGEEIVVDIRWSFMGAAVQWFGNVVHHDRRVARIGGRVQLATGMESSAPSAVLVDARRELSRRSAELEGRVAELHTAAIEAPSTENRPAIVDLELELSREAARGDLLWKEFFGAAEASLQGERQEQTPQQRMDSQTDA